MEHVVRLVRQHPYLSTIAAVAILSLLSAGVVAASLGVWPRGLISFKDPDRRTLAADADIAGWATLGRDSYFVGDTVSYTLHLLYRPERLTPDLAMLERSLSFGPFEKIEVKRTLNKSSGLGEATVEFILQGIDVLPGTTYQQEPALVYTIPAGEKKSSPTPLRVERPAIHVSSYYPADVSQIALHDGRSTIGERAPLRQGILGGSAIGILIMAGLLVWRFGRRRRAAELSEPARLWQEFHGLDREALGNRNYILKCERIFTRLLEWRTQMHPLAFWSGENPREPSWDEITARARALLSKTYQADAPAAEDAERIAALLRDMLAPAVDEERLRRENVPSFASRLKQQPQVLVVTGASAAIAVILLFLAALPGLWLSPDLRRYNETVHVARGENLDADAQRFAVLGKEVETPLVKAAALYNAGTARARLGGPAGDKFGEDELLHAVFQREEPVMNLLDDQNSIDKLLAAGIQLAVAERELKDAVRLDRQDEEIRRNLELVVKRHRAVRAAIKQLFDRAGSLPPSQRDSVIDVLNMKMPEEFKQEDKGKDNTRYMILEKF